MFLQVHDLPAVLVTQVDVHGVVHNLAVGETEPVQVLQEVAHQLPESLVVVVAVTVVDDLLEHKFAAFPLRLGHDGVEDQVVFFLVHGVVNTISRTLREFAFVVEQVVGLVFDLVQVAELEASHEFGRELV